MTATVTELPTPVEGLEAGFTAPEVVEMTGCSYRQLDYWTRCGYLGDDKDVRGLGSGNRRFYSLRKVEIVYFTVALLNTELFQMRAALQIATDLADGKPLDLAVGAIVRIRVGIAGGE